MQSEVTRAVGEVDQLRQECGVAKHDVVGVVDRDDEPRQRRTSSVRTVVAPLLRVAVDALRQLRVVVGQADHMMV